MEGELTGSEEQQGAEAAGRFGRRDLRALYCRRFYSRVAGGGNARHKQQQGSMHKELIGQEASLSLPCTVDATALLLGFIKELMEVGGSEASDPDRLEHDLRQAVDAIRGDECGDAACDVVAIFEIHERGVEVRLSCESHDAADVDINEHVVAALEA